MNQDGTSDDELDSRLVHRAKKKITYFKEEEKVRPKAYHRQRRQREKVAPVRVDSNAQATLDYIGENLDVRYNVRGNDGGRFHVDIVLTNSGTHTIPSCCWAIYFYHMKYEGIFYHLIVMFLSQFCQLLLTHYFRYFFRLLQHCLVTRSCCLNSWLLQFLKYLSGLFFDINYYVTVPICMIYKKSHIWFDERCNLQWSEITSTINTRKNNRNSTSVKLCYASN